MKGIYIQEGKKGHYELEEYEDVAMNEKHVQHDGEGAFVEQGVAAKRKARQSAGRALHIAFLLSRVAHCGWSPRASL